MKKLIASILALIAINSFAYDITNTVTIVSNIYNRVAEEHWITNNVKNTHVNYYFTNNVYTVTNKTLLVSQQNFVTNTTVNLDVSQQAIADARGYANAASQSASSSQGFADTAADRATDAQSAASRSEYYASQAQGKVQDVIDEGNRQVSRVNSTGQTVLNNINAKQSWFDEHFGQMVTNVNHNYYQAEDGIARNMASSAQVAAQAAGTTANSALSKANALETRMSSAETRLSSAETGITQANQGVAEAKQGVASSIAYTTAVSNKNDHIYNDGSGYSKWYVAGDNTNLVVEIFYDGVLDIRYEINPKVYTTSSSAYDYTSVKRVLSPTSHAYPQGDAMRIWKVKSNGGFYIQDKFAYDEYYYGNYIIYWMTGSDSPEVFISGAGTRQSGMPENYTSNCTLPLPVPGGEYDVFSDLTIRKRSDGKTIATLATDITVSALSNKLNESVLEMKRDNANSISYTTAVSNKLEQGVAEAKQGVAEAKQGVAEAKQMATAAANSDHIYNNGTGYSKWYIAGGNTNLSVEIFYNSSFDVRYEIETKTYISGSTSYEYTSITRTTSSTSHVFPGINDFRAWKEKSTGRFYVHDVFNVNNRPTPFEWYWATGSQSPSVFVEGAGTRSGATPAEYTSRCTFTGIYPTDAYDVMSDLTIRKRSDGSTITTLATEMSIEALKEWIEQTFQKK